MRIATMTKQLLDEVRTHPLDTAGLDRLRTIDTQIIGELLTDLSPDLRQELQRLALPITRHTELSDAELRLAHAPFAAVTPFRTDFDLSIRSSTGRANVFRAIDAKIASTNLIYAIRVTGRFTGLHTRTVMAQTPPYPPLTTATKDQTETVFEKAAGTIVGFRTPDFEQGISVAGYHLHFLSGDHAHGGHVLDFAVEQGQISVSTASQLHLSLPTTEAFLRANLSGPDLSDQIQRVEGGASPPHR